MAPSGFSLQGKVCVVTGGANGIGEALCIHFASNGAKKVVVVDMNLAAAQLLAEKIGGIAIQANCGVEMDIRKAHVAHSIQLSCMHCPRLRVSR